MLKRVAIAAALAFVTTGSAWAQCPGPAIPWTALPGGQGVGIGGLLTCNKDASKCEQKVGTNVASKLVSGIVKCQAKLAKLVHKGDSSVQAEADEQTCEDAAVQKFLDKTDTTDCPCVDPVGIDNLAEGVLNANAYLTYCEGWDTLSGTCTVVGTTAVDSGGELTGCVRGDDTAAGKAAFKCAEGYGKCIPKLVKDWIKCNGTAAKNWQKNDPATPLLCQNGPIPGKPGKAAIERWNTCVGKVQAKGGCAACQAANEPAILGLTGAQLNGANGLIYCMSVSGAFLD